MNIRSILSTAAMVIVASGTSTVVVAGSGPPGSPILLGSLAADGTGFKLLSRQPLDEAGIAIAGVGDVNGDDLDDILLGAKYNNEAGSRAGAAYVVFGTASSATIDLNVVEGGTGGFKITGEAAGDHTGYAVAAAGDVNRDGLADLLITGRYNSATGRKRSGATYLVFGKSTGTEVNLDAVALGVGGFKILGQAALDFAGHSAASVSDLNGDGRRELIVGAHFNDAKGSTSGSAYVVFGKDSGGPVDLANLGAGGFRIIGQAAGDHAGWWVDAGGDMNSDGLGDLLIGAPTNDAGGNNAGAVYVVFGKASGTQVDLANLGAGGFRIRGERAGDNAGWSVASAGDMNGDSRADLIVGAKTNDGNGGNSGAAYLVWGKASAAEINLDDVAVGAGGFKILGGAGDLAGWSVAGIPDVNGDGIVDLLIGAVQDDAGGADAGAAYVVYGKSSGATIRLSDVAAGVGGFKIVGERAGDWAGGSVAGGGDLNGDGLTDLLVASRFDDAGGTDAGAGYAVFGDPGWVGDK